MQPKPEAPVNLETRSAHRHQFLWHILMPVLLGTILLLLLGVFASTSQGDKPAVWADISLIFIVVILMFSGIGSLIAIILACMGTDWLTRKIPPVSYITQVYIQYFGKKIAGLADSSTKPVMEVKSDWAALKPLFHRFQRNIRKFSTRSEE